MKPSLLALLASAPLSWAITADAAENQGKLVYEKWCAPCHSRGEVYPGTTALDARYKGAVPASLEDRSELSPELVKYFVRNGISVMPFFRKTEINDIELDSLARYLAEPANKKQTGN
ncbi:cytochrome c [Pseudomonas sp. Pse1]|uniref:c-type cytochrome n=1 Tax=Pseudomonas sp. Pse1 TaxID=2926020 RepID=UPI0021179E98|nr:cytochrome c [Pseudomonas sp. Pse1]